MLSFPQSTVLAALLVLNCLIVFLSSRASFRFNKKRLHFYFSSQPTELTLGFFCFINIPLPPPHDHKYSNFTPISPVAHNSVTITVSALSGSEKWYANMLGVVWGQTRL